MEVAFYVLTGMVLAGAVLCAIFCSIRDDPFLAAAAAVLALLFGVMTIGCWNLAAHQACDNREVCDLR